MFYGRHPGRFVGHGVGFIGWLLPLLILAGLAAVLAYLVIRMAGHRGPPPPFAPLGPRIVPDPAVEQARMRYARGEMSRDDYFRLVEDLIGATALAAPPGAGFGAPPPGPPPSHPPGPPSPPGPPAGQAPEP